MTSLSDKEHEAQMAVAKIGKGLSAEGEGVDTIDTYAASVGLIQCADDLQQRGLAGSAGTNNAHYLAFVDMEVDAFQYL